MLTITVRVDALSEQAQGVKESLAMFLEQFGDTQVIEVKAPAVWQTSLFGVIPNGSKRKGVRGR